MEGQLYLIKDNILKRYIIDGDDTYETTVVPKALTAQILRMTHDELGHNELIELIPYLRDSTVGKD